MQDLSTGVEETIRLCDDDLVELFGQSNDMDDETRYGEHDVIHKRLVQHL